MLQSMGSQKVGHNLATEQQQQGIHTHSHAHTHMHIPYTTNIRINK